MIRVFGVIYKKLVIAAFPLLAQIDISPLPNQNADPDKSIPDIVMIVFGIVGSVSLLMVVIGGTRYILSEGDPQAMSKAKGTVVYAILGLAITLAAFSIVTLVVRGVRV